MTKGGLRSARAALHSFWTPQVQSVTRPRLSCRTFAAVGLESLACPQRAEEDRPHGLRQRQGYLRRGALSNREEVSSKANCGHVVSISGSSPYMNGDSSTGLIQ